MKTATVHQELLLVTASSHIQRPFCENNNATVDERDSVSKLEEACWNGMLDDLLPGMIQKASSGRDLCLWQLYQMNTCLLVDLCEVPLLPERAFSIDPSYFLNGKYWS
jgi:hypothetical protein